MKKWDCDVCGYIYGGENPPKECPVCKAPIEKFNKIQENIWIKFDNKIGMVKNIDKELTEDLRKNFNNECSEVGMYMAMSAVAQKEGYLEIAKEYKKIALEEAEHASEFAQLLGELVEPYTKSNLKKRAKAEYDATQDKLRLAKRAKELGIEEVHDTVNKMCKDEARHGKTFTALLNKYFNEY